MAKRKATEREEESAAITGLSDIYSAEELNPALAALQTELGYSGDMLAKVFVTLQEADGKEARIWNGTPDEYDIESLAKKYGSGDYRVKIMVKMPNGPFVVRGNGIIRMKLTADEDARLKMLRDNPQALHGQQAQLTPEAIAAAVRAAMPLPVAVPTPDYTGMLIRGIEVLAPLLKPAAPPAAPQVNPIEIMKLVVGAVQDSRRGGAGGDDDEDERPRRSGSNQYDFWNNLINRFTPLFQQVMAQRGAGPVEGLPPMGTPENPLPSNVVPLGVAPQAVVLQEDTSEVRQLKQGLSFIVSAADGGHDPTLYADLVLNQVPEESLRSLLAMPDPLAYLASLDVRIAGRIADWFKVMLAEVKAELDAPDEESEALPKQ